MKGSIKSYKNLYRLLGIISLLLIWLILSLIVDNEIIIPRISSVFTSLINIIIVPRNLLIILSTFGRLLIAVIACLLISLLLLSIVIWKPKTSEFIRSIISVIKTIPIVAIIIILLIWFGAKNTPLIITSFMIIPLMVESMLTGFTSIDKSYLEELKINGDNYWYAYRNVYLPLISPYIYLGFMQSLGLGLKVLVTAELISQTANSIGNKIYLHKMYLDMSGLFAWVIILITLIIILEYFIRRVKNKFSN